MIKILRIINRFNLGGPTHNVAYLTKYMPSSYQTLLIGGVPESHEADSLHILQTLEIEPLIIPEMSRSINPYHDWKSYQTIRKIIKRYQPHIVHTHASKAGVLGRWAAIQEKVPIIVHTYHGHIFHSYFNPLITQIFLKIEKYLASQTSAIIAISPQQKIELAHTFKIAPEEKFEVIPLGLNLQKFSERIQEKRNLFRQTHQISENTIVIGIVGRLVPIKNHYLLIDAIEHIKKHLHFSQPIEVLIVGDGYLKKKLMEYIIHKNLTYRTQPTDTSADFYFTSWIKDIDVAYAAMDIVTLTSKNEGTPVSILEAQACGKILISTNVGGIKDILHPEAGLIVDSFSPIAFAEALLKALSIYQDKNDYIQQHISPSIIQQYSYTTLVQKMDNLYQKLIQQKLNKL